MIKFFIFLTVLLQLLSTVSHGKNLKLQTVIEGIKSTYEKINDFHAEFEQEAEIKVLEKVQKANGEVWFKKTGMMRWNYHRPHKDEIVSDGEFMWHYDKARNQVMESSLSGLTADNNSTTLLSGLDNIDKLFNYQFTTPNNPSDDMNNYLIDLTPKNREGEQFYKVTISVNSKSYLVNKFHIYDLFGNKTTINLKSLEINKNIPSSKFKFKKPEGAELIKYPTY